MPYDLPIYQLDLKHWRGTATGEPAQKLSGWIEANVAPLAKEEFPSRRDILQAVVQLSWEFYYSTRGAAPAERETLLATYLTAMETLHDRYLDVKKLDLIEERIVREPAMSSWGQGVDVLPRDPELAEIVLSPEDV